MPRDPSGNYSLPALGNPAVTATPITIAWWNGTSTDMASAFTDSLSRSGLGGMLVPFKLVDGSSSAPAFSFQNESNTGFYRAAAFEMDVAIGGTRIGRFINSGYQQSGDGGATWFGPLFLNAANPAMTTGSVNFASGTLLLDSIPIERTVTKSSSTGTFSTPSTSFTPVTNANLTFTATGGPVLVTLVPDDTSNTAAIAPNSTVNGGPSVMASMVLALSADGGSTFFAQQTITGFCFFLGFAVYTPSYSLPGAFSSSYTPAAGSGKTIGLYAKCATSNQTLQILYSKLQITQL